MDTTYEGMSPAVHGVRRTKPSGSRWPWSSNKAGPLVSFETRSTPNSVDVGSDALGTDPTVPVQIAEVLGRLRRQYPDKDFLSLVEMIGASPDATDEALVEAARELARPV